MELLSRVMAGETKLMFTKMALSEKPFEEYEIKQELVPLTTKDTTSGMCRVILNGIFSNVSLTEGYTINTILLFAKDDNDTEVLFSYLPADEDGGMDMTKYNGEVPQSINISVFSGVSVNDSTMIIVNPDGMASMQYVHDYVNGGKDLVIPITGWTEELDTNNKPYYTKVFDVEGIKVGDKPIGILKSEGAVDITTKKAIQKSWRQFFDYETGNGTYKILSYKIPTVSFTMTLIGTGG